MELLKECRMRSAPSFIWILIILVVILFILQIIHVVIFSCLELKKSDLAQKAQRLSTPKINGKHLTYFRMDTSGSYQVYHSVLDGTTTKPPPRDSVTIVTHCSSHNLHYLPALVERWKGPISVAVFSSVDDFHVSFSAIHSFIECFPDILSYVQFHLVLPMDRMERIRSLNFTLRTEVPCNHLTGYLQQHLKTKNYALSEIPYPNNLLRNVARLGAKTNFILTVDVDILPNPGLYTKMLHFFNERNSDENLRQTAFVLPVFEVEESKFIPENKDQLTAAISSGTVRQFYVEACFRCQSPTDYNYWLTLESSISNLQVAYTVEYQSMWEPFVIIHKSAPLYDERFKQYGYNRVSHICELYMAGFTFAVLDSGFLVHQGFKKKGEFHTRKDDENAANRDLFREVQEQLQIKYPDARGICVPLEEV